MSELNKQNINVESLNKIVSKFVAKLLKYRIMFKDLLTFMRLDYGEAAKNEKNMIITSYTNIVVKKAKNQYVLNGRMDFLVTII